jgi:flagellar basal-body rod protein FlgB
MIEKTAVQLERYMDILSARQKVVASNIANNDTPGYKTRDIDFQFEYLSFIEARKPRVLEVGALPAKNDGNNVSLDRESRLLAENAMRFSVASTLAKAEFRSIRNAAQEGRT